ncbi:RNA-binding protein S1, partial [Nocardia seriolae]
RRSRRRRGSGPGGSWRRGARGGRGRAGGRRRRWGGRGPCRG